MAAQPAPALEAGGFNLVDQLKRKFGIGPQNWDAFNTAAVGNSSTSVLPTSGANVTLKDISRNPSTVVVLPNDDPQVRALVEDDGGWVGVPDPTKYAPGTNHLSPKELQEEIEKGNVVLWKDFKRTLESATGEEREALQELATKAVMQHRRFYTLRDGSKVSMWDLYQYLFNNPELEALRRSGRRIPAVDPRDPGGRLMTPGEQQEAAQQQGVQVDEEDADWGLVARGSLWRRRPTRWLGGLDGVKDWDVGVLTHQTLTNQVLGAKYGGRDPFAVVADPSYARDVLRCGPLLSMTFVLTAARDLQLKELVSSIRDQLSARLQRQAPLVVPRRLRPTLVDPTDLNLALWPATYARQLAQEEQRQAEEERRRREQGGAGGSGGEVSRPQLDEMGVSWRQTEAEEHRGSVQKGLEVLQSLPDLFCPGSQSSSQWPLSSSPLVDPASGRTWRKGGSLWVTLEPEGGIWLRASAPVQDPVQDPSQPPEGLLLGHLTGQEALAGAVMDSFLGPQPADLGMAANARAMMLVPVNGFTLDNRERDPNNPVAPFAVGPPPPSRRLAATPSSYRLVAGEEMRRLQPVQGGTVLAGIRDSRATQEVQDLLQRASAAAVDAAAAAPSPSISSSSASSSQQHAHEAAVAVLREGMEALGPDARGLLHRMAVTAASPAGDGDVLLPDIQEWLLRDEAWGNGQSGTEGVTKGELVSDLFSLARGLEVDGADA